MPASGFATHDKWHIRRDARDTLAVARPIVRSGKVNRKSVEFISPTVIIDDISVKLPKSVSDFLFSGIRIIRRAPVVDSEIDAPLCQQQGDWYQEQP
jgi:hypothetical protein